MVASFCQTGANRQVSRAHFGLTDCPVWSQRCSVACSGAARPATRVTQVLDLLVALHRAPIAIHDDSDPGFVSVELTTWFRLLHIPQGEPNRNAYT